MADAPEIYDDAGIVRKLGTLVPPPGQVSVFAPYLTAGPLFTLDEIRNHAKANDTLGRTIFDVSWIKDQKSHGSCNGYAAAAALSRARVRRRLARVDLSGAYVYSRINGGRDQGSILEDGMRSIQSGGICSETTVGWDQIYPSKYDKAKADAEAARFKAFECYTLGTEEELFSALMGGFDCVVAVDVDNSYMRLNSEGVAGGGRGAGNHAICLDGYKVLANGQLAADNPGSWNTTFGDKGRCFLTWDKHFANTVRHHQFYACRSASDDPQGENPPDIGGSD